mmetsp:Transcript_4463/g.11169  ORF Transcript_4463/g.11169 Transcript_4463/m.11169 type:complete len:581 (+) Transcript_4463:269-2011(+)
MRRARRAPGGVDVREAADPVVEEAAPGGEQDAGHRAAERHQRPRGGGERPAGGAEGQAGGPQQLDGPRHGHRHRGVVPRDGPGGQEVHHRRHHLLHHHRPRGPARRHGAELRGPVRDAEVRVGGGLARHALADGPQGARGLRGHVARPPAGRGPRAVAPEPVGARRAGPLEGHHRGRAGPRPQARDEREERDWRHRAHGQHLQQAQPVAVRARRRARLLRHARLPRRVQRARHLEADPQERPHVHDHVAAWPQDRQGARCVAGGSFGCAARGRPHGGRGRPEGPAHQQRQRRHPRARHAADPERGRHQQVRVDGRQRQRQRELPWREIQQVQVRRHGGGDGGRDAQHARRREAHDPERGEPHSEQRRQHGPRGQQQQPQPHLHGPPDHDVQARVGGRSGGRRGGDDGGGGGGGGGRRGRRPHRPLLCGPAAVRGGHERAARLLHQRRLHRLHAQHRRQGRRADHHLQARNQHPGGAGAAGHPLHHRLRRPVGRFHHPGGAQSDRQAGRRQGRRQAGHGGEDAPDLPWLLARRHHGARGGHHRPVGGAGDREEGARPAGDGRRRTAVGVLLLQEEQIANSK